MSLPASFPASADALANPTATTNRDDAGFELDLVLARIHDILEALEAKVGIGASLPSTASVLRRTAPGTSAWGQVVGADIAAQTITGASVGSGMHIAPNTIYGGQAGGNSNLAAASIITGDLAANAATQVWRAVPTSSSPAYASPALAQIAEMNVSITTTGGPILILYFGTHHGSVVGTTFIIQPFLDGSALPIGSQFPIAGVNTDFPVAVISTAVPSGSTASPTAHTVEMRQSIGATPSQGGIVAYSLWRSLTVVEFRR